MTAPSLVPMDYIGPAIAAGVFVLLMSTVREPARRTFNAVLVAGTAIFGESEGVTAAMEHLRAALLQASMARTIRAD